MACIRVDGHEVPLLFPVAMGGLARVFSHLLHVRFKFVESSIYVEVEKKSSLDELLQSFPIAKLVEEEGHCQYL